MLVVAVMEAEIPPVVVTFATVVVVQPFPSVIVQV
jgi:hypothetical protein